MTAASKLAYLNLLLTHCGLRKRLRQKEVFEFRTVSAL
jgi:hypothetical protein